LGFWIGLLVGLGVSIIFVPLFLFFLYKIKEAKIRRKVKKMLGKNQFLVPIDRKDFDNRMWEDKINLSKIDEELEKLDTKIFSKRRDLVVDDKESDIGERGENGTLQ